MEMNPSLWVETAPGTVYPTLDRDVEADVIVVGSGITGLTTARLLAGRGLSVVVIEARKVCYGTTGFTTAKVTSLQSTIYSELSEKWGDETAAVYAAANQAAVARVRELVAADGIQCDLRDGTTYTYAEASEHLGRIEAEVEAAGRAGLDVSFTTDTELPFEIAGAVRLGGQAQFHPRQYCLGLAEALVKEGGLIFENTPALELDADTATVTTDAGTARGGSVVVATQIPFVNRGGHFARMTPSRSYALGLRSHGQPMEGMYISVDQPTRSVRSTGDGYLIVGGEGHPVGTDDDTNRRYHALESWAAEWFPSAAAEFRWSAEDYRSVDRLPFVGRLSKRADRVFVATGLAKWGMTNGTLSAMIISDLIEGTSNPWAETFDSTRAGLAHSLVDVVAANFEVAKHFVGDRVGPNFGTAADLPSGTGAVVLVDGQKVAAFRDDSGVLHSISPTCTHLGCLVSFNTAERSWDCPCHGSRFDVDGNVLHGPAIKNLAVMEPAQESPTDEDGDTALDLT